MFALSSPGPVGDAEALRALRTVGDDIARFHQFMRKKVLRLKDTTDPGLAALRTTCRTLVLVGGGGESARYGPGGHNSCKSTSMKLRYFSLLLTFFHPYFLADGQYVICNDTLGLRDEKPRRKKPDVNWKMSKLHPQQPTPFSMLQRPLANAQQQPSQPLPRIPTMDLVAEHGDRPRGVAGIKCAALSYGIVREPAIRQPAPSPLLDSPSTASATYAPLRYLPQENEDEFEHAFARRSGCHVFALDPTLGKEGRPMRDYRVHFLDWGAPSAFHFMHLHVTTQRLTNPGTRRLPNVRML